MELVTGFSNSFSLRILAVFREMNAPFHSGQYGRDTTCFAFNELLRPYRMQLARPNGADHVVVVGGTIIIQLL